MKAAH
jgi:hypothetical protein